MTLDEIMKSLYYQKETYFLDIFGKIKHNRTTLYADRNNCPLAIIIGGDEAAKGVASVKNLKLGKQLADTITDKNEWKQRVQKEIPLDILADEIKKMLAEA